jgi:hypothetical protein
MERKIEDMKMNAILHGADPKDLEDREEQVKTRKDNLLFGDPAEYEKLDEAEKKKLSERMKQKFFGWAGVKNG